MILDLQALSAEGNQPFDLELHSSVLRCSRIVRRVTGKRLVCQGVWKDQAVFAKIFLGPHAQRHARRDRQGSEWLAAQRIATPSLLYAANQSDFEILIYQAIPNSQNAEEIMNGLSETQARLELALAITKTVAQHHAAGIIQTDLYLKNFLVQDHHIYTLDGDGIRQLSSWRRRHHEMTNLATLWSKLDAADDGFLPDLYDAYCCARQWSPHPTQLQCLLVKVRKIRHEVITEYADSKVFRECTDVHVEQDFERFQTIAREWVGRIPVDLDAQLEQGLRLKSGNTCTVGVSEIDGRKIVLKRYNIKNLRHGFGRAWRSSRAARSWANTYRLRIANIATAQPVAMREERWGPLRRRAWFLAEYVDGPDVAEWMTQGTEEQRRQVAQQVARLLHKMRRLRFAHGDLKATNIKIVAGQPVLIDLDSLKEYRCDWLFKRHHARDLRRLLKNWHNDAATLALMIGALQDVYGDDPVLAGAIRD